MADGSATGIRATHTLHQLGFRRLELTAAAEVSDNVAITVQLTDLGGNNIAEVQRCVAMVVGELAAAYTLAEDGAGAEVSITARPGLVFTTSAAGAATIDAVDVVGGSDDVVSIIMYPLDCPMLVSSIDVTFDAS